MAPRPAAAQDDLSAGYFLDAAAELIDAMFLGATDERPRRFRGMHFPVALEWMRVSDVVRLAQAHHGEGASEKALRNRWPARTDFVKAAIVHTLLYRDAPESSPALQVSKLPSLATDASTSDAVIGLCDGLLDRLQASPRSYLLHHIGPLLDQYPVLKAAVIEDIIGTREPWYKGYADLLTAYGLRLRPGWTTLRLGLALQAMLDGFLLRTRVQTTEMKEAASTDASLFADTIIAFVLGVLDGDGSQRPARDLLDESTQRHRRS